VVDESFALGATAVGERAVQTSHRITDISAARDHRYRHPACTVNYRDPRTAGEHSSLFGELGSMLGVAMQPIRSDLPALEASPQRSWLPRQRFDLMNSVLDESDRLAESDGMGSFSMRTYRRWGGSALPGFVVDY
jgi:hypothetical protein